jgi:hypothetical protein
VFSSKYLKLGVLGPVLSKLGMNSKVVMEIIDKIKRVSNQWAFYDICRQRSFIPSFEFARNWG